MEKPRSITLSARSLEAPCNLRAVVDLCRQARLFLASEGVAEAELDAWELALAEAANNAVNYCSPSSRHLPVRVDLLAQASWIEGRVTDHTPGFDWPEKASLPSDDSESGRGLFLIQSLTDEACYLRGKGENCLVLRKRREPQSGKPESPSRLDPLSELHEARSTLDLMTEELASSYESLAAIFSFSAELQSGVNSDEFIQRWLHQLLAITDSDWFVLRLFKTASQQLQVAAASNPGWQAVPVSILHQASSVETSAASKRTDIWFDDIHSDSANETLSSLVGSGFGLAHPLYVSDVLVGVLSIGRKETHNPYRAGHVSVIHTFGDFLGIQIRSRQMQDEQLGARLNARDLEIAARIQRDLLPTQLPSLPGSSMSVFYRSAREIGGDYYDALPLADGGMLLIIADVMGKGLPAALFAFMFRSLVRARPDLASKPGVFLGWLNRNLFKELDRSEMFITAQLAFLDTRRGTIQVAGAGHPPLLITDTSGNVDEICAGGPPLGIVADSEYSEESHPAAGRRILMFTDGLIESRNLAGAMLGLQSVKHALALAETHHESCEKTKLRLTRLLEDFEQGSSPADDTAFIIISGTSQP